MPKRPVAPPGTRVCRLCSEALPLDDFMPGRIRYVCRKHYYEQQHRCLAASKNRLVYNSRKDCEIHFNGCSPSFNGDVARSATAGQKDNVFLMPRDPALPLSADNIFVCDAKKRRVIIDLWRLQANRALYMQLVETIKCDD
jgi:hypothetical protein